MSNIVLNIVEPASPTPINPVDPGIDPVVPNTGLFTSGISGAETAIIATVSLVVILAIVAAIIYYRKKKQGKLISLKHKKAGLATLALLVSIGTVAGLVKLTTRAIEGDESETQSTDDSSALTVDVSSTEFTIELADDPVFAVLPVDITVEEATTLGYTLTAFAEDTNLVSTTDSSKTIPMVTVDATDIDEEELETESLDSSLVPLSPNTYGLSFTDPTSITDEVYTSLSTDSTAPTFITDKDYLATAANDTTTIYYGFYITPDIPYGTYTGSNISVDAIPNIATVTYNANGLYYNDEETSTENIVGYKPNIAEAPIEEVVGEYITPAPLTPVDPSTTIHYTFLGWSETEGATTPTYTNEEDILANLTLTKNESLTLYAVWHYDTVLSFDGNTSDGGSSIPDQTIAAGETIILPHNTYTRTGSVFTGWNTAADGSGEAYADEASFTAPLSSADITLYAQWAYTTTITFSGNGATSGSMSPQTIVAGTPQNLTKNAFTKTNATFIGWNTQANGSGTSYTDEAEFTASTTQHQDITLYAQWAYTTISFNGNTSDSGTMNSVTIAGGTTSNLPANTFIKNNCIFTGWNTVASGTGVSYGNSSPYQANATLTEAFTLYAQWQCVSQVNYLGNGATSGEMSSSIILGGSTLTFTQNSYAKDGYIFNGWNTKADGTGTSYPDQGTFTAPMTPATTLNLYAQWKVPVYLYNNVAAMSKGTQTLAQLQEDITAPTTDDPSTDQSNSGVYEYNSSVFGGASDASNANKIYYYRGILEQAEDQGSYGSDGKATTYPNYVKLGNNTCWRIVRTTGSGGVKMVYNGAWTGSTCANSSTNARTSTQAFASKGTSSQSSSNWYKNIHYVGYTFNNSVTDSTAETSVDTVFGSDANPSLNNARSNIKTYIEDTWYASNMTAYTNLLEPAAGYCNDRTAYSDDTTTTALSTIAPYKTSSDRMYFGAYGRNMNATNANKTPSLTCPRSTVDLYRYVPNSTGVSNELKYPAALLTADESSLAGSGSSTASQGSSYNAKSYLRSGSNFWLLSPGTRNSYGYAGESFLSSNGDLYNGNVNGVNGVRPAISLKPGTTVADGEGTATNPWTIDE